MAKRRAFDDTNRLRVFRRFVGGYACLIAGMFGLFELGTGNDLGWKKVLLGVLLVISGAGNLMTTRAPEK